MDQRKRKTILSVTEKESPGTDEPEENCAPSRGVGKDDRDCRCLTLSGLQTSTDLPTKSSQRELLRS